jgi:anti-sigma regulatory factor (Ser/Thr protein kinase)
MPSNVLLVTAEGNATESDLADRLRDESWTVLLVRGTAAAAESLGASPAAVLLVDAPVWDDPAFRKMVADLAPALPVIVLTHGDEHSETLVKHLKLGAATFIPKAASKRELRATIRSIIDLCARNPYRERVREFLHAGEIEMRLDNDPASIGVAVGFIQNLMDGYHVADHPTRVRLGIALSEALSNAMIHGNLEIDSALRAQDVEAFYDAIERRRVDQRFADRRVILIARVNKETITFIIRDSGTGFRLEDVPDPTDPENLMRPSGRGILMMRAYTDSVEWNATGNEVTLVKNL